MKIRKTTTTGEWLLIITGFIIILVSAYVLFSFTPEDVLRTMQ